MSARRPFGRECTNARIGMFHVLPAIIQVVPGSPVPDRETPTSDPAFQRDRRYISYMRLEHGFGFKSFTFRRPGRWPSGLVDGFTLARTAALLGDADDAEPVAATRFKTDKAA